MKIVQTFTDSDGNSVMEEIEMDFETSEFIPGHAPLGVSPTSIAQTAKFLQMADGWESGWHPTPVRQYVVVLTGDWSLETGDGQVRVIRPGEVVLLEDTTGRGHFMTFSRDTSLFAVALD